MQGPAYTGSPMKRTSMPPAQQFQAVPVAHSMFATFDSNLDFTQENYQVPSAVHDTYAEFPEHGYSRRPPLKRSYSDAAHTGERPIKRSRPEDEGSQQPPQPQQLPEPEDMPPVEDDGNKPQYSYAQMIGMAILRAPQRQLTLAQIYDWISTTFAFYRDDPKQGWHNSIRHNLSLNKAFTKKERPKGDAGKGSYWIIEPGMEPQFLKDKQRKHSNVPGMTIHQNGSRSDIQIMAPPLAEALAPKPWSIQPAVPPPRPQTAPALPELSSDATLPASDPALEEEETNDAALPSAALPSSPAPILNSSPPVVASNHNRTISSPVLTRAASNKQHRRSATVMEDSGYWSEIPSSHRKSMHNGIVLTSELDIAASNSKKLGRTSVGRAEDEIRRMRSSPRVPTPDKQRLDILLFEDESSSPVRPSPSKIANPTTPAFTFKKPLRPPPSVSPNSQLLFHRQAMNDFTDSPLKVSNFDFEVSTPLMKTPGVNLRSQFEEEFEVWEQHNWLGRTPATPGLNSSPLKKSVKRPGSLLRTNTSAGILSEMTNTHKLNAKTPSRTPLLKSAFRGGNVGSPLKTSTLPSLDNYEDFFTFGDENLNVSFEEASDGEGLDLSQGFGKIGAPVTTPARSARPGLGPRSQSTRF